MINPEIQSIIQESIQEMRSWEPKWGEDDIFHSACGAALKYAESQGQDSSPELRAAIQAVVRQEMKQS